MMYETRITTLTVVPTDQEIFSEMATKVSIVDEASGEYVEVEQSGRTDIGKICINPEEWPHLREAIDSLIKQCRDTAKEPKP